MIEEGWISTYLLWQLLLGVLQSEHGSLRSKEGG